MNKTLKRILEDKKIVRLYLKGEATKKDLDKRNIKLANPIK